jgi:hypothetical protein
MPHRLSAKLFVILSEALNGQESNNCEPREASPRFVLQREGLLYRATPSKQARQVILWETNSIT